jgi:hypothetical protein
VIGTFSRLVHASNLTHNLEIYAGAGNRQSQDSSAQQETRGVELALDEIQLDEQQTSEKHYAAEADEEDVAVEVITGNSQVRTTTYCHRAHVGERDAGLSALVAVGGTNCTRSGGAGVEWG